MVYHRLKSSCSMFYCTLCYVHSSIAITLIGKRELVNLHNLSSWCLVVVGWLFLAVPLGFLRSVIVAFPEHTHLLVLGTGTQWLSDKVLTRVRGAAGLSLTGVTALRSFSKKHLS